MKTYNKFTDKDRNTLTTCVMSLNNKSLKTLSVTDDEVQKIFAQNNDIDWAVLSCQELIEIRVEGNPITTIDISGCPNLKILGCDDTLRKVYRNGKLVADIDGMSPVGFYVTWETPPSSSPRTKDELAYIASKKW